MTIKRDVGREPIEIPFPLSLLFVPILFVGAALSYPCQAIADALLKRRERRFEAEMMAANRSFMWDGSVQSLAGRGGTLIEEWFGPKGPVRWWRTRDDISAISPYVFTDDGAMALFDGTYDAFSLWCHDHYLKQGTAALFVASGDSAGVPPLRARQEKLPIPVVSVRNRRP